MHTEVRIKIWQSISIPTMRIASNRRTPIPEPISKEEISTNMSLEAMIPEIEQHIRQDMSLMEAVCEWDELRLHKAEVNARICSKEATLSVSPLGPQ